jgi:molybdate transport system permease protein
MILDGLLTLPLVLPPTVIGFLLLIVFGVNRPLEGYCLNSWV